MKNDVRSSSARFPCTKSLQFICAEFFEKLKWLDIKRKWFCRYLRNEAISFVSLIHEKKKIQN